MGSRNRSEIFELDYNNKLYLYTYEELRDDSDSFEGSGYNMTTEESIFNVEIYNEKDKLLKEVEIEADAILEVTDDDIKKIIDKYKL